MRGIISSIKNPRIRVQNLPKGLVLLGQDTTLFFSSPYPVEEVRAALGRLFGGVVKSGSSGLYIVYEPDRLLGFNAYHGPRGLPDGIDIYCPSEVTVHFESFMSEEETFAVLRSFDPDEVEVGEEGGGLGYEKDWLREYDARFDY